MEFDAMSNMRLNMFLVIVKVNMDDGCICEVSGSFIIKGMEVMGIPKPANEIDMGRARKC